MKKTYRKNIWRTIRQTISRFGAIFAIVALGVGFLTGLLSTTPDMRYSGDVYYDDTHLFDVRVISSMGLTESDVKALRAVEGVSEVMPAYYADMVVSKDSTGDVVVGRFHSLPDDTSPQAQGYLNRILLTEGRMPTAPGECVIEPDKYGGETLALGDTITITQDNKNPDDTFAVRQFTVVGLAQSSYYFSFEREPASVGNGSVGLIAYTPESSFDTDGVYTNIFLTLDGTREMNSLTDAYTDTVDSAIERIEAISGARCEARLAQIKTDANAELADARQEYEDAKAEAEEKLNDAAQKLADGQKQVTDGQRELADAKQQIADGQKKLDDGNREFNTQSADGYAALAQAESQLASGRAELDAGRNTFNTQKAQYAAGMAQVAQGEAFVAQYTPRIQAAEGYMGSLIPTPYPDVAAAEAAFLADMQQKGAAYQARLGVIGANPGTFLYNANADLAVNTQAQGAQLLYLSKQAALDSAMLAAGYTDEAAWLAADPAAQSVIAERDNAKVTLDAFSTQLDPNGALNLTAQALAALTDGGTDTRVAFLQSGGQYIQFETMKTLAALRPKLDDTVTLIATNKPVLAAAKLELDAAEQKLADAQAQIDAGQAQLEAGRSALESGLSDARAQLDAAAKTLADARKTYASGVNELDDARVKLADGQQEYADAKAEADEKLADAKQQIDDAQQAIDDLEMPEWFVLGRGTNVSYASFLGNTQKVEAIATVFPIFFFLVAALVALTTMTRMVEEERLQIGTMKALGYGKGAIMAKYIFYALTASIAGSAVGVAVGYRLFPTIIWNAYTMMYNLPNLYCQLNIKYIIIASGAAILCTLLATLNAGWSTLHEAPAQLMRPRAPKAGKRIFLEHIRPLWGRMKFTHKVTARNLFLYKKRFYMTVIGIAGCTALLVTGFGLHDSISDIVNKQFGQVFTYDLTVAVKNPDALTDSALNAVLNDPAQISAYMVAHQEKSSNTYGDETFNTYIFVPQEDDVLEDFVTLRKRVGGDSVPYEPDRGVVITEKMAERTGLSAGDMLELKNTDGQTGTFLITGVAENYIENYVYMSQKIYQEQYGKAPEFSALLARQATSISDQSAKDALSETLLEIDAVTSVNFISDLKVSFTNMMTKIDTIVVVLIVCAALLAFVVLYNLTNINITEREKEIATIKVLGFFDNEVSAYVYRENVVLSLIGALTGLVLGIFLHRFVIYNVEVDAVMFGRTIKALSYVWSFLLTLAFSALVNLVMRRKLRRISMVESMKAPE